LTDKINWFRNVYRFVTMYIKDLKNEKRCKECGRIVDDYGNDELKLCVDCNRIRINKTIDVYNDPQIKERIKTRLKNNLVPKVIGSDLKPYPYDQDKIVEALRRETGLDGKILDNLVEDVSRYLISTHINIITAPMIREVVNSLCLKYKLEGTRLKHTRVGIPKFDLNKIYEENGKINYIEETIKLIDYMVIDIKTDIYLDKKTIIERLEEIGQLLYKWYGSSDKKILNHIKKENENIDNLIKMLEEGKEFKNGVL